MSTPNHISPQDAMIPEGNENSWGKFPIGEGGTPNTVSVGSMEHSVSFLNLGYPFISFKADWIVGGAPPSVIRIQRS